MRNKVCLYCGNGFQATHGNQNYCPGSDCYLLSKLYRQNKNYEIGEDAKKAIQKNYKIFQSLLGRRDSLELDLIDILKLGFDQDGYYISGKRRSDNKQCFKVHHYYFHITGNSLNKIQIWKTPK